MAPEHPATATAAFTRYTDAFRSLDPGAVPPSFHLPALMITPQGVVALTTAADVEAAYRRVMADLPARGYDHTEFHQIDERRLGDDLAVVEGSGAWKTAAGAELSRFGMSYTMRRVGDAWRIVVAVIHDPMPAAAPR